MDGGYTVLVFDQPQAPGKRLQHCWPTTPNIVRCYVLRPFARPVACCCVLLGVVAQRLKLVKRLAKGHQCWDLLRPFHLDLDLSSLTTYLIAPVFTVSFF